MIVYYKNKKINIPVKKICFFARYVGLMFKSSKSENLLFEFKKKVRIPIHSCFVFFDFLALWLDEKNHVMKYEIVKPFSLFVRPKKHFSKLVEIPMNKSNKLFFSSFVDKKEKFK
jgi:uncharacterized membrane protein (UPF0127 family)